MGHYGLVLQQAVASGVGPSAFWDSCPFPYRALSYITMAFKQRLGGA